MAELPPSDTSAGGAFADDAFAELVTRYFTGPLREDDLAELVRRLEVDPSARRLFLQFARLDGLLTERSLTGKAALPIAPNLLDIEAEEDASQLSMHDATVHQAIRMEDVTGDAEESVGPAESFPIVNQSASVPSPIGWKPMVIKISAAAAILLIACLGGWLVLGSHHPRVVRIEPVAPPIISSAQVPAPLVQLPVVSESRPAKLAAAVRAQWGGAGWPALKAGDAIPNCPLELKAGWIRVDFPSGVTAVVEGPAQFEVRSPMEVALKTGRIAAHVPPPGHGFAIQTPQCRAVDLGTEFGIAVNDQGENLVQVFEGKVSLARGVPAATSQPSGNAAGGGAVNGGTVGQIVVAGEGLRIESVNAPSVAVTADPSTFVLPAQFARWVKPHPTALDQWRTFNEQLMRDPGLELFYTLDDGDEHEILNHAVSTFGQYDLQKDDSHGPIWTDGRLPGISALSFDSSKRQYLILPKYPITQTGLLSCAVWIKAHSYVPFGSVLKNWGDTKSGSLHLGFANTTHQMEIELDGTRPGGPVLADPEQFPLNRWVHVAFVSDGKTVRLYRDGKEVASCPSRLIPNDPAMTSLAIGCKTGDDGINPAASIAAGFWDGEIGEIALFQRVLAPEEILRMSQQGRP